MAKVLFIQPHKTFLESDLAKGKSDFLADRTDGFARPIPSLPAMTVLGALDSRHEPHFIDAAADAPDNISRLDGGLCAIGMGDEQLCEAVSEINPYAVLLTSMFSCEYFVVNNIARLVKKKFGLPVVAGGHHASLRPGWHLDEGVDFVSLGEGELNVNEIMEALEGKRSLTSVRGLAYLDASGNLVMQPKKGMLHDLDQKWDIRSVAKRKDGSQRYPLRMTIRSSDLYMPEKDNSEGTGVLYPSRGCPYNCEYCNATKRDGKKIRHMSLERMIEITESFIREGATTFYNQADTLGAHELDREYFRWLGRQRESGIDISLINNNSTFARFFFPGGVFSPERVDLLKKAGFRTLTISIESFNPKYNKGKLKGINPGMLDDCFAHIRSQGLNLDVYMIYLYPGQTEEELKQDMQNIERLSGNITKVTWRSLAYFPGTHYYDRAIRSGRFTEEDYKSMVQKGHSFYHMNPRFNLSDIRNPPNLVG